MKIKRRDKKIAVGMSGGVDSSAAAAILKNQGLEVVGATLKLWCYASQRESELSDALNQGFPSSDEKRCCSLDAIENAKIAASKLNIPHYIINAEALFEKEVIKQFTSEYISGRTPNPCIACNHKVKIPILLKKLHSIGVAYVATGHYARIVKNKDNHYLFKAVDKKKDQSYFLYRLGQDILPKLILPLGTMTKQEVRDYALEIGLPNYKREESQDICFIDKKKYPEFIESLAGKQNLRQGDIVDLGGKILGKHNGLHHYTIGQRKKIGVYSQAPLYVLKLDVHKNVLVVGGDKDLLKTKCIVKDLHIFETLNKKKKEYKVTAKIRYKHEPAPARISISEDRLSALLEFMEPQRAITPGQAAVFYAGDMLLGGGTIFEVVE